MDGCRTFPSIRMTFIRNVIILSAGVFLAALIVPGIEFGDRWNALALVILILALFNAVIKPILVLFTLPFIFISLGFGLWIINAILLYWAAHLVDGFSVSSFWAALGGAFVISITNLMLSGFRGAHDLPNKHKKLHISHRVRTPSASEDDVIDI